MLAALPPQSQSASPPPSQSRPQKRLASERGRVRVPPAKHNYIEWHGAMCDGVAVRRRHYPPVDPVRAPASGPAYFAEKIDRCGRRSVQSPAADNQAAGRSLASPAATSPTAQSRDRPPAPAGQTRVWQSPEQAAIRESVARRADASARDWSPSGATRDIPPRAPPRIRQPPRSVRNYRAPKATLSDAKRGSSESAALACRDRAVRV